MDLSSRDKDIDPFQNLPSNAVISSTPRKKTPPEFTCPHCSKKYVKNHYFLKHISDVHGNLAPPADLNVSLNVSAAVHIDPNDVSLSLMGPGPGQAGGSGSFQVPAAPAKKATKRKQPSTKPQLICTYCLKPYVCPRSFKSHLRAHSMQEASAYIPDAKKIAQNSLEIGNQALTHVSNSPSEGQTGLKFKELLGHIAGISLGPEWSTFCKMLCEELLKGIANQRVLLPSALSTNLIQQLERILSDFELSDNIFNKLQLCEDFNGDSVSQFFLEFSLNFTSEILKFISKTFRDKVPRKFRQPGSKDPDKEERQVIYYIAGSIMRGYLKIARRSKKSETWQNVASVIKTKVLIDKPVGDLEDSEWTADVDRGGLLYISVNCQKFFVPLTKVVYQNEKKDGSINYLDVISEVTNSSISVLWDNVISDSLPENVSLNLMNDVVMCFCRTCGRGIAKRRLNSLRSKPLVSMPTRHLVASRKNRN